MPSRRCCCGVVCDDCNGTVPDQIQIDFTNVTDSAECADCDTFYANSFIVDRTGANNCIWELLVEDWCPGCAVGRETDTFIRVQYVEFFGTFTLRVEVFECPCCNTTTDVAVLVARFEFDFSTTKPDCLISSQLTLTPVDTGFWSNQACVWDDTVVTCKASAV